MAKKSCSDLKSDSVATDDVFITKEYLQIWTGRKFFGFFFCLFFAMWILRWCRSPMGSCKCCFAGGWMKVFEGCIWATDKDPILTLFYPTEEVISLKRHRVLSWENVVYYSICLQEAHTAPYEETGFASLEIQVTTFDCRGSQAYAITSI